MKKIEYPVFLGLFKNFFSNVKQANIVLAIIFIVPTFLILLFLQSFMFLKTIIGTIFPIYGDSTEDSGGVRVTKLIVFFPLNPVSVILTGVLTVPVFIGGFGYDIGNKIMTLGKSETFFLNF